MILNQQYHILGWWYRVVDVPAEVSYDAAKSFITWYYVVVQANIELYSAGDLAFVSCEDMVIERNLLRLHRERIVIDNYGMDCLFQHCL